MTTAYHAKYFSHELTKRSPSGDIERVTAALMDSQVDLNPHQVDAALFAFRSPLSNGAILADEVGLGKTIEAGIVLSQRWAEGKRKILIILPSSLRKQWHQELMDKFYLPSQVLESTFFNREIKKGVKNPFDRDEIVLCSYPFARNKDKFLSEIPWDLVVIDEAHRLRNVYKPQNKIANAIRDAVRSAPKLLLTATPLQNTLLELYGLVSFIDGHTFGDIRSFKQQFSKLTPGDSFDDLKQRLSLVCKRTLRRQVLEYIRYTKRICHTEEFIPSDAEQELYDLVSEYLQRDNLNALPSKQRKLMTLILRKLLASSTFAIAGALNTLANKLERQLKEAREKATAEPAAAEVSADSIGEDFESFDSLVDEFMSDEDAATDDETFSPEQIEALEDELTELRDFHHRAANIAENAKGKSLLKGLKVGFKKTTSLGGAEKTIIFTESRRTQDYLLGLLNANGYEGDIVLFNGTNNDEKSKEIYSAWKERHAGSERVTGSRTADIRAALVDYFRDEAKIMIATEAAAEGINLQFCSMIVNYDLPWNPQRIEQRIGRCHRYGQKHDVVVVNFLNKKNAADQRVYELLNEKFQLFNGVFGASDEVLGTIESGVDFEKRIVEIYQTCRTSQKIQLEFDFLQEEMEQQINENMQDARTKLLENFDTEVAEKLNVYKEKSAESISKFEAWLWDVTQFELAEEATFSEDTLSFELSDVSEISQTSGIGDSVSSGKYGLRRSDDTQFHYRMMHPLAKAVLSKASDRVLPDAKLTFHYSSTPRKVTILDELVGESGTLSVQMVTISSLEAEDHIVLAGSRKDGTGLTREQCVRLFNFPASVSELAPGDKAKSESTELACQSQVESLLRDVAERNATFFDEEIEKLDRWSGDLKQGLEGEIKDLDKEIREAKKAASLSPALAEKLELQKKVKQLEAKRKDKRKRLFDAEDEIDSKRDGLISETENRLSIETQTEPLFHIRWEVA